MVTPNRISVGNGSAATPGLIFNGGVTTNGFINHDVDTGIFSNGNSGATILAISIAGTEAFRWNATYSKTNKHLIPNTDNTFTLGIDANRWSTIYTMNLDVEGSILPKTSATYDIGSTSLRWNNIYTTDLQRVMK